MRHPSVPDIIHPGRHESRNPVRKPPSPRRRRIRRINRRIGRPGVRIRHRCGRLKVRIPGRRRRRLVQVILRPVVQQGPARRYRRFLTGRIGNVDSRIATLDTFARISISISLRSLCPPIGSLFVDVGQKRDQSLEFAASVRGWLVGELSAGGRAVRVVPKRLVVGVRVFFGTAAVRSGIGQVEMTAVGFAHETRVHLTEAHPDVFSAVFEQSGRGRGNVMHDKAIR